MINIENYISKLIGLLHRQFGERLLYVGLQGSHLRGEATDSSDIDMMVVIDELRISDLDHYRTIIESMEHADKACGFIGGKAELANWNPLEMCHLLHTTKDYYGVLRELVPGYSENDIRNFVKLSLNNLYHEVCHRYIHAAPDKSIAKLPGTYKGVFFILQNLYFLRCGEFVATKAELLPLLGGMDRAVLERSMDYASGITHDFSESFELLFTWCQETMKSV